ncbi:MAG: hypothetical protein AB7G06_03735 [Bdellovibrionales bacterium]
MPAAALKLHTITGATVRELAPPKNKTPSADFLAHTGIRYVKLGGATLATFREMQEEQRTYKPRLKALATEFGGTDLIISGPNDANESLNYTAKLVAPDTKAIWKSAIRALAQQGNHTGNTGYRGVWSPLGVPSPLKAGEWQLNVDIFETPGSLPNDADACRELILSRNPRERFLQAVSLAAANSYPNRRLDMQMKEDVDVLAVVETADGSVYLRLPADREYNAKDKPKCDVFFCPAGCKPVPTATVLKKLTA